MDLTNLIVYSILVGRNTSMKYFLAIITVVFGSCAYSQTFENLVFEGGGIRGIAYCGAIAEVENAGEFESVKRVAGTSAGAITASFLAVGYSAQEIQTIIYNTDFGEFNDGEHFFVGGTQRLIESYGWYRGEAFSNWLESHLARKTGIKNITFSQLHQKRLTHDFLDLYVCATSLTKQRPEVFSFETYPNMKVADAVRISMSVPFWFQAVGIDGSGNIVDQSSWDSTTNLVIDGGLLSNFPIGIFDEPQFSHGPSVEAFDEDWKNSHTLGFRLDSEEQIEHDIEGNGLAPQNIENIEDFTVALYLMVIENLNRQQLDEEDWTRSVSIDTCGIGPKVKSLSPKEKDALINAGKKGLLSFLDPLEPGVR
jgi:NTE family protein